MTLHHLFTYRCAYYETCATYGLNVERVFQDGDLTLSFQLSSAITSHYHIIMHSIASHHIVTSSTTSHHIRDIVRALIFLWKTQFKGCGQKKIERISLEGELSWVAGRKNRRAPNRCSYLTLPHLNPHHSDFFSYRISSWSYFVISACQKICVARGAAPRPTTPTHFVPRPYPGKRVLLISPSWSHSRIKWPRFIWVWCLADFFFRNSIWIQVMWLAPPMVTPQPPTLPTLLALPFLTTRSPFVCLHFSHISPIQVSPAHAPQPLPAFSSKVNVSTIVHDAEIRRQAKCQLIRCWWLKETLFIKLERVISCSSIQPYLKPLWWKHVEYDWHCSQLNHTLASTTYPIQISSTWVIAVRPKFMQSIW